MVIKFWVGESEWVGFLNLLKCWTVGENWVVEIML